MPGRGESAPWVVRTALCVEPRNGRLYIFLPPVKVRTGLSGFVYRHPTMAVGGFMLLALIAMAIATANKVRAGKRR